MNFKKIMVGVDESPDALKAFRYAIQEARHEMAELIIVSVLEEKNINVYQSLDRSYWEKEMNELKERCEKYKKEALEHGVVHVTTIVNEGNPGELIVNKFIPLNQPDLLVIGARSTSRIRDFFGSQAAYMARYAKISTIIIR
ncbi:hypothetical protein IGI39_003665 [Enterococcus sp. AZ135]|uniref:universal stress protein n=1 Tax=unclassified Enterococcus TaxID=2608891 RepID=UPI003F24BCC3